MMRFTCSVGRCGKEVKWVCCSDEGDVVGYYCEEHAFQEMRAGRVDRDYGGSHKWFKISKFTGKKTLREIVEGEGGEVSLERASYLLRKNVNEILRLAEEEGLKIIVKEFPHVSEKRIYLKSWSQLVDPTLVKDAEDTHLKSVEAC